MASNRVNSYSWKNQPYEFESLLEDDEYVEPYDCAPPEFFDPGTNLGFQNLLNSPKREVTVNPNHTWVNLSFEVNEDCDKTINSVVMKHLDETEGLDNPVVPIPASSVTKQQSPESKPTPDSLEKNIRTSRPIEKWDSLAVKKLIVARAERLDFKPYSADSELWDDISENLMMQGYNFDASKCIRKWKDLLLKYKAVFKKVGDGPVDLTQTWELYPIMRSFHLRNQHFSNLKRRFTQEENEQAKKKKKKSKTGIPSEDDITVDHLNNSPLRQIQNLADSEELKMTRNRKQLINRIRTGFEDLKTKRMEAIELRKRFDQDLQEYLGR